MIGTLRRRLVCAVFGCRLLICMFQETLDGELIAPCERCHRWFPVE